MLLVQVYLRERHSHCGNAVPVNILAREGRSNKRMQCKRELVSQRSGPPMPLAVLGRILNHLI